MADTITTVIVTYNRKHLLKQCLDSLLAQDRPLDRITLMDNASTDGTNDMLKKEGYLDNKVLDYTRLPTNTGGAAGFHDGMKKAFEAGYDWIWMMDDDVNPAPDCLSKLLKAYQETGGVYKILQTARFDADTGRPYHYATRYNFRNPFLYEGVDLVIPSRIDAPYIEIVSPPFEGPLIHRSVIADVGESDGSYFIVCDDADYFLRAHRKGHRSLVVRDAVMTRATPAKKTVFFDWKDYYTFRNRIELDRRYGGKWIAVSRALYQFTRMIVKSLRPSKHATLTSYRFLFRALVDGLKGVRGKTIFP